MKNLKSLCGLSLCVLSSHGIACGDMEVISAAKEIGVTPESIVVADLADESVLMLSRIADATSLLASLETTLAAIDSLAEEVTALSEDVLHSDGEGDVLLEYHQALSAMQIQRDHLQALRADLFAVVAEGLSSEKVARLSAWRIASHYRVPAEFRVLALSGADWEMLEKAVSIEQAATRRGEDVPPEYAAPLEDARTNVEVAQAALRLEIHLSSVEDLFYAHAGAP